MIAEHPLACQEPPVIVRTAPVLAEMIKHLATTRSFAYDSEFIGERSYVSQLCLVQVATTETVFLVDPLVGLDLSALWEQILCPAAEKVVLAGQQDLEPVVRHTGQPPANIMDLQIAAGLVHAEYPLSLARLLQEFVGVSPGKSHTFSHWDKRPLTQMQVRYAADDVRYLPAARDAIGKRLAELGRTAWAREECASALEDLSLYQPAPDSLHLRVRGRDKLGRRQLAVLRELAIVRDQAARQENVPVRSLLTDGLLLALSRQPVRTLDDLDKVRGLPRPVEKRYGQQIVEATSKALSLPQDRLPPKEPTETDVLGTKIDRILDEISRFCQERSIAPSLVVAGRKEIVRACRAAAEGPSPGQHRLFRGWRKELLGSLLERLL